MLSHIDMQPSRETASTRYARIGSFEILLCITCEDMHNPFRCLLQSYPHPDGESVIQCHSGHVKKHLDINKALSCTLRHFAGDSAWYN